MMLLIYKDALHTSVFPDQHPKVDTPTDTKSDTLIHTRIKPFWAGTCRAQYGI